MTVITRNDVIQYAEELESISPSKVRMVIEFAKGWAAEGPFGTKYKFAIILMTAHLLTMGEREGAGGAISSESVGDVSVSYANGLADNMLSTTSYGQMFIDLRTTVCTTPLVV